MTLSSERRHDLDWLRVLGVLLLIPFHVALIFVLQPYTIMYIRDVVNSPALTVTTGFIHMWHMPMLFMVSGAATYFALGFRSAGQYIRERFLRLFIPLAFGLLTFIPFTIYIQHSQVLSLQEGYLGFFHIDFEHLDGMNGSFTPAHLWFILYLFVFSLVGLPIFIWLRSIGRVNCSPEVEPHTGWIQIPITSRTRRTAITGTRPASCPWSITGIPVCTQCDRGSCLGIE